LEWLYLRTIECIQSKFPNTDKSIYAALYKSGGKTFAPVFADCPIRPKPAYSFEMGANRLDQALVERGLCDSREKAQRAIMAGQVTVNEQPAKKPSDKIRPNDQITLASPDRYVSRGGLKLEHALHHFHVDAAGKIALDLGASTGGFTDCLLQHGAAKVYAVDVGHGQLAWKLRNDPGVAVMEKTNARDLTPSAFPQPFAPFDLAVIDCSFISLTRILPVAIALLRQSGTIVALIKPQFEAGKAEADKGRGVITDAAIHARVLRELEDFVERQTQMAWRGTTESPLLGPAGNKEFFALIEKTGPKD
jgi:23S rRNA (cytidine1920-2'-O)/16S rRNA (cytidine1409-2'-O)-methyltransferase